MKQKAVMKIGCAMFGFVFAFALAGDRLNAEESSYRASYLETLEGNGLDPSADGALAYLRDLHPDGDAKKRIADLIRRMGHDVFAEREKAMIELGRIPSITVDQLGTAVESANAEVRWRALRLLENSHDHTAQLMLAALRIVALDRPPRACPHVLAALPFCREPYLIEAVHDALRAVSQPDDVDFLTTKLNAETAQTRIAVAVALSKLLSKESLDVLYPLLDDASERVALEAARAIANRGDRRSFAVFLRLLESKDAFMRAESAFVLRALTGKRMRFASYDTLEKRTKAVAAWRDWMDADGRTAKLVYPVARNRSARGNLLGNTLVSTGSKREVMELDPAGNVVWRYNIDAWSAEKLPNGNVLIASYVTRRVVEVDSDGNVVWELSGPQAMTAKPLLNGNFLIADFGGRRVIEVNRRKQTVWEHKTPDQCFDADRLPNGNTIFGCPNLVREVTPDGKTVRQWD
ncbi:MAG: HEAT repeat domain-containing protein, partial [Planctomycetes bacterium]|nr:HEAT repeat domain-containing protein [Planctomycetota bacterium]